MFKNNDNSSVLRRMRNHPYIGKIPVNTEEQSIEIIKDLNKGRENNRGPHVKVIYYFETLNNDKPMMGLKNAAKMLLEHGTVKPWYSEGDSRFTKPVNYDNNMSWIDNISLIEHNAEEGVEAGIVILSYPLHFFDKTEDGSFPFAQLMMAIASEPFSAFSFYQGARIVDIIFPEEIIKRFPGVKWPHKRILEYLNVNASEPIIGTIVKPKAGLTPELFANSVVEAALAGARFTKADENMHLTLKELPRYVSCVVKRLESAGFELGKASDLSGRKRFIFAPHITTDPKYMMDYAKASVDAGANALMFSPYYSGGFQKMAEITEKFDIPVYAHTAGMNVFTGALNWGIDPSIMYRFAAYYGAAFMQLTATKGYLKPDDTEKSFILKRLKEEGLQGKNGMTLVIAGGLGPGNIGMNMKSFGIEGKMFLAGTSVYSHPGGPSDGVKAIIQAYRAYCEEGITEVDGLVEYGHSIGVDGKPLIDALRN